jgi:hypothetical protein
MTTEALARPLIVLAPLIRSELEAGDALVRVAGIEHYRKAGEMLLEAKEQCGHGEWTAWVNRNFHLSITTAQRYIKLVGHPKTSRAPSLSSITEPHRAPGHRATWHEPVQRVVERVNTRALVADQQSRAKETKLIHALGHQLIDIGYKVLAAKLHPDKGGSAEAMARLNRVRQILKGAL